MSKLLVMHVHATSQNKGDYALLNSLLKLLDEDIEVVDVCTQSETHKDVVRFLNIKNMRSIVNFFAFSKYLLKSDALVLGGGDVITASNNLLLLAMAKVTKTPVYFVGVGVNLKHVSKLSMFFLKYSLSNVSHAFIRDSNSATKMLELGLDRSKLLEVSDLTFAHGADSLTPQYKISKLALPENFIAVSMRAPEFNSSKWGEIEYKNIANGLDRIVDKYNMKVVFISMADEYQTVSKTQNSSDEIPDSEICKIIQSHMSHKDETDIISSGITLDDVMSIFDKATVAICCRLHAMIFSTLVATPFIGLTYNLKSVSYLRDAGMSDFGIDLQEISSDELYSKVVGIIESHELATASTQVACQKFTDKAKPYSKLKKMVTTVQKRSVFRLFHPKLWLLYLVNFAYEIYTKYSR